MAGLHPLADPRLKQRLHDLSRVFDQKQLLTTGHYDPDVVLHHLERPPELDLVLEIEPHTALQFTQVELTSEDGTAIRPLTVPLQPHPYLCRLAAGFYRLGGRVVPYPRDPYVDQPLQIYALRPPGARLKVRMLP